MSTIQFDEAARLFAEHAALVEAMRVAFQNQVDSFLEQVRVAAALRLPEPLQQRQTPAYREWWMSTSPEENKDSRAHLWFPSNKPEIINPGRIDLTAVAPQASRDRLPRLAAIARDARFSSWCRAAAGGPWSLFTATLTYAEGDELEGVAERVASLLVALREAETEP